MQENNQAINFEPKPLFVHRGWSSELHRDMISKNDKSKQNHIRKVFFFFFTVV